MKKIFMMFAMMFVAMFASAQVDSVTINGNGTYTQYVDTLVLPVDSTMTIDTIGFAYDTTMVIDTVSGDTSYVVDSILVIDVNFAQYDTVCINMITAIPDSGWVFTNWIVTYVYDSALFTDTVVTETMCTDLIDSLVSLVLNFDTIENLGITNVTMKQINAYPNPTTGRVNFSEQIDEYNVYGVNGQRIMYGKSTNNIDLSNMPNGMYFIQTNKGNSKIIKK